MKYQNLHGFNSINKYVKYRLNRFKSLPVSYQTLFEEMFFEEKNIIFEYSEGYYIHKETYGDSKKRVIAISNSLNYLLKDLKHNDIVAIYLENDLEWIETFWAILRSGFRPLLLNKRLSDDVLESTMKDVDCKAVISINKKFKVRTLFIDEIKLNQQGIENDEFGSEILFMSSGTSENVKVCSYNAESFTNIIWHAKQIITSNKLVKKHYEGELKLLTILPFYHIFGFVAVYTWFAFFARTFVGINSLSPDVIRFTITRHKVTHVFAVPLLWQKAYEAAMKAIKAEGEKTSKKFQKGLKIKKFLGNSPLGSLFSKVAFKQIRDKMFGDSIYFLISGGAFISPDVLEFFNAIGYHMCNGYGTTEIGITSVELSNKYKTLISASIGEPLHGTTYTLNEKNELIVKSNSMSNYIMLGKEKIDLSEGYNTHDLMKEEKGRYYFLSREDDLIVSITGENLNPNIIEESLKMEKVEGAALINGRDGNMPIILLSVNKYLSSPQIEEILKETKENIHKQNLQSQIGKLEVVKGPLLVGDEFKLNRKRIEREYYEGKLNIYVRDNAESNKNDEITLVIRNIFIKALKKEKVDNKGDFFLDLGGSSLEFFSVVSDIYNEFSVDISKEGLTINSVETISGVIQKKL